MEKYYKICFVTKVVSIFFFGFNRFIFTHFYCKAQCNGLFTALVKKAPCPNIL